jgi:DNA polymerase III gamma/tau subunit
MGLVYNPIHNRKEKMKLADTTMESGYTFQQELLLQALERQALTGILMTNPRVTGFTSFAKAVLNFINDKKAPKTCKNLYKYLLDKGYYDKIETRLNRKEKND